MNYRDSIKLDPIFGLATDTVWGLACKAKDYVSVSRIFELKKRDENKPLILFAESVDQASEIIAINPSIRQLLNLWWPGPLSFVGRPQTNAFLHCHPGTPMLGVRVPANDDALHLLRSIQEPLAVTSFNISGEPEIFEHSKLQEAFPNDVKQFIGSMKKVSSPSIVIMQTGPSKIKILRYSQDQMKRIIKDCEKIDGLTIEY